MKKKTKQKRIREPKPLELCYLRDGHEKNFMPSFPMNATFIFLGEIPNMPGHGVFIQQETGEIHSCYHINDFRALTEEEV